ncbi:MAG: hypothetical protein AB7F67_03875 [Rhodospirillaceae bacterium]
MSRAVLLIRHLPPERFRAFERGLAAAGYQVAHTAGFRPAPGDILVSWNRYGTAEVLCDQWERDGGVVLVAENGYVGTERGVARHYAIGLDSHNDPAGVVVPEDAQPGERSRDVFGLDPAPWQRNRSDTNGAGAPGGHILIAPNRSFGRRGRIMPEDWADQVARQVRAIAHGREVRIRRHPGTAVPPTPLAADLAGAFCAVVWSSSVGVAALLAGVPVIALAPAWIGQRAASRELADVLDPPRPARNPALDDIAWGMWTPAEVEAGAPFKHLAPAIAARVALQAGVRAAS